MFSIETLTNPETRQIASDYLSGKGISIQTSGSTGTPKMYLFSHEELKASARRTISFFKLTEETRALLCISHKTIGGAMMIIRAIEGNYHLDYLSPTATPLSDKKYDFVAMAPLQLVKSLEHSSEQLHTVKHLLIGGGPIPDGTIHELNEQKISVWHSYGMTETCSHVALKKTGFQGEDSYHALPGIHFLVNTGQLGIKMNGKVLWTNDLVELIDEQTFNWLGRLDFTINSGGYKIQIEELEEKLSRYIFVDFCIWKEPDETLGEKIVMICTSSFQVDKNILLATIERYHIPKTVYLVNDILKSELGKKLRKQTFEKQTLKQIEAIL